MVDQGETASVVAAKVRRRESLLRTEGIHDQEPAASPRGFGDPPRGRS